jgi:hypothetical protein
LKERSKVKVLIWFLTIKSQKSLWFTCVQVMCHISLESSQQGLQLFFWPHLNWRSIQEITSFKNAKSPNFENSRNFWIPNFRVLGQNGIWLQPPWLIIENTIREKLVVSPMSNPWWVVWICVCLCTKNASTMH